MDARMLAGAQRVRLVDFAAGIWRVVELAWRKPVRVFAAPEHACVLVVDPDSLADKTLLAQRPDDWCGNYERGVLFDVVRDDVLATMPMPTAKPRKKPDQRANNGRSTPWTEHERALLRELYPTGGAIAVQQVVARSAAAIQRRAFVDGVVCRVRKVSP